MSASLVKLEGRAKVRVRQEVTAPSAPEPASAVTTVHVTKLMGIARALTLDGRASNVTSHAPGAFMVSAAADGAPVLKMPSAIPRQENVYVAAVSLDLVVICPAKKTSGDLGAKIGVSVPIMQLAKVPQAPAIVRLVGTDRSAITIAPMVNGAARVQTRVIVKTMHRATH